MLKRKTDDRNDNHTPTKEKSKTEQNKKDRQTYNGADNEIVFVVQIDQQLTEPTKEMINRRTH